MSVVTRLQEKKHEASEKQEVVVYAITHAKLFDNRDPNYDTFSEHVKRRTLDKNYDSTCYK